MKRQLFVSLFVASAVVTGVAQEVKVDENNEVKSVVTSMAQSNADNVKTEIAADTASWKFPGTLSLSGVQTSHNPYSVEGEGTVVGINFSASLNANYIRAKHKWDSKLDVAYGTSFSKDYEAEPYWRKQNDELKLMTKYGYLADKNVYYTAMASFETQFTPTYDYDVVDSMSDDGFDFTSCDRQERIDTGVVKNMFVNPAYAKLSLGLDMKMSDKEDIYFYVSPLSARWTFCENDVIAENYSMEKINDGDNIYKNTRFEAGVLLNVNYSKSFNDVFSLNSSLEAFFAAYGKPRVYQLSKDAVRNNVLYDLENIKSDWEDTDYIARHGRYVVWKTEFMLKATKFLTFNLRTQLKYDNSEVDYHKDLIRADKGDCDDTRESLLNSNASFYNYGYKKAFLQFWESSSLGISYSF
ncbi:MAG: DUF3078 domain-containing protein [Paludibacteraceae bacterium]|nr:DUF3078 domain-containing protein [Paludibacteraceae bacterium]